MNNPIKVYDFPHPLCLDDSRPYLPAFGMVCLARISTPELVFGNPPTQTKTLKFMFSTHLTARGRFCHAKWRRGQVLKRFGNARLIIGNDGKHELIGGNETNFTEAKEWVSLFAHEVVFTRSHRCQHLRKGASTK
jgi:hypothetical protein